MANYLSREKSECQHTLFWGENTGKNKLQERRLNYKRIRKRTTMHCTVCTCMFANHEAFNRSYGWRSGCVWVKKHENVREESRTRWAEENTDVPLGNRNKHPSTSAAPTRFWWRTLFHFPPLTRSSNNSHRHQRSCSGKHRYGSAQELRSLPVRTLSSQTFTLSTLLTVYFILPWWRAAMIFKSV